MSDDEKREHAIAACRKAVSAWIEAGDAKAGAALRDALHALSAVPSMRRQLREKAGPRRRKAA